jgi:hypothetical protein
MIKTDASGIFQWQKSIGGSAQDYFTDVEELSDGSFVMSGYTTSNNDDVSGNHGGLEDAWLVKTGATGNVLWQHCFGGSDDEQALSLTKNYDGGWLLGGYTKSHNGDVTDSLGGQDLWIVNTDSSGAMLWQKSYGGSGNEVCWSLAQTSDEGFIVAGSCSSYDGEETGNHGVARLDYWAIRLMGLLNVNDISFSNQFHLFPIPVTDFIHVSTEMTGAFEIHIINQLGQTLLNEKMNHELTIDVSDFSPGIYFLEMENEKQNAVLRFVKSQ